MKAALFDLDNTLYDTQQYFVGALNGIAKYLSTRYNMSEREISATALEIWQQKTSMYPYLFNDLLELLHLSQDSLPALVKTFNEYVGTIEPYPDAIPTLCSLKGTGVKLGIITDGNVERQKRKIELLGLSPFFDAIVYAKELEPKPSSLPFLAALERLKVKAPDALYVADNPLVDFQGAKEARMKTIRVVRGEFVKVQSNEYIDFEIEKLNELLELTEDKA